MKKVMMNCFMCGCNYQFGPHIYDGKHVQYYSFDVCNICWNTNWDGWNAHYEKKVVDHLMSKNIPLPSKNSKGWFPREILI